MDHGADLKMDQAEHPPSYGISMTPQDALRKVVSIVGSQSNLAKVLGRGLTQSHIHDWLTEAEVVPAQYCPDIELLVNRAVMCEELNPTVNWGAIRNTPPYVTNYPSDEPNDQIGLL